MATLELPQRQPGTHVCDVCAGVAADEFGLVQVAEGEEGDWDMLTDEWWVMIGSPHAEHYRFFVESEAVACAERTGGKLAHVQRATLRDEFAMRAMFGVSGYMADELEAAAKAYRIADAMLRERAK